VTGTALLFAPYARAATIDFNTATGNYDSALDPDAGATPNWIDLSTSTPVGIPAAADDAYVRNGGTVAMTASEVVTSLRIGASRIVTNPDTTTTELGGSGILNWTAGDLTSPVVAGPILRVGERATSTAGTVDLVGTVNQTGGKISLTNTASALTVGASGTTPTPVSTYNLMPGGTIATIIGASGNNGINVRNGVFNMTGGSIIDDPSSAGFGQRAMTISSASGPDAANPNVSTATISGGTWDTRGGIRMAANSFSSAYLTILPGADIKVRSDVNMTNNATSSYAELNMSGGSFKIGDTPTLAEANLVVGDRAVGVMNLSGGTVTVSNNLRVSNDAAGSGGGAGKGTVTITAGSLTTRSLDMRVTAPTSAANYAAGTSTIIIDGPTASFAQGNTTLTGSATIGNTGISLFEVRQGVASLGGFSATQPTAGNIELAKTATAAATLNLKGGRLIINGNVNRTNVTPGVIAGPLAGLGAAPVVGLTGGILEINPVTSTLNWQTDMTLNGTELLTKLNAQGVVNVGDATHPGNFTMNAGSMWDIDLFGHLVDNADRVVVGGTGTGAINGGTLNLNYISGYTPLVGDSIRIVTTTAGVPTLNSGAVNIVAPVSPLGVWTTQVVGAQIRLVFIPEPTSCALAIMGMMVGMAGFRRRS
jgi:hypothetical protein